LSHHLAMPITREELYEQIWAEPAVKVAARYGASGSYFARVCTRLRVPRPDGGYWAKLAAGKRVAKAQLPPARPGDEQTWVPDVAASQRHRIQREPDLKPPDAFPAPLMTVVKGRRLHRLVDGAEELFRRGEHRRDGYVRPATRQLPDICVPENRLRDALALASTLFNTLEARGYDVVLAPGDQPIGRYVPPLPGDDQGFDDRSRWYPARCTVTYIGTVAIGLAIIETAAEMEVETINDRFVPASSAAARAKRQAEPWRARLGWASGITRWMPSGDLQLYAYCPYKDAEWSHAWSAPSPSKLRDQIPDIISTLESTAHKVVASVHAARIRRREAERLRQIEMAKLQARWHEERRQKLVDDTRKLLLELGREWVELEEIRRFLAEAERADDGLADDERAEVQRRIDLMRRLVRLPTASEQLMRLQLPSDLERLEPSLGIPPKMTGQ
jgi:hypothetical protein